MVLRQSGNMWAGHRHGSEGVPCAPASGGEQRSRRISRFQLLRNDALRTTAIVAVCGIELFGAAVACNVDYRGGYLY